MAALFIIPPKWQKPKCLSIGEQINKMWYILTREHYSAIKRGIKC